MSLATKVKALRQKKAVSLQEVADGVGISKAHIWEIERGSSKNPSADLLTRIANYFSVPPSFFLNDKLEPEDAAALQFFREFDGKLSDRDWDTLRMMANRLKSPE